MSEHPSPVPLTHTSCTRSTTHQHLLCFRRLPLFAARDSQLPEYKVAASQGFDLEAPLGSGHFGRVYKARNNATGQVGCLAVWLGFGNRSGVVQGAV